MRLPEKGGGGTETERKRLKIARQKKGQRKETKERNFPKVGTGVTVLLHCYVSVLLKTDT